MVDLTGSLQQKHLRLISNPLSLPQALVAEQHSSTYKRIANTKSCVAELLCAQWLFVSFHQLMMISR
jgi:hypothetical protein